MNKAYKSLELKDGIWRGELFCQSGSKDQNVESVKDHMLDLLSCRRKECASDWSWVVRPAGEST